MKQEYTFSSNKDAFKSYMMETRSHVESELTRFVVQLSKLNLYPQIKYAVLSKGKRLRPLLVVLSAQSVGGKRREIMRLALSFELMHTATLIHDDIIDQDENRRGKQAVHVKWSVNDAILTGDALIALSVDLASTYGENVLKTVAQSALELCDGERLDITHSPEQMTEEAHFRKIREKSASLFAAATYCGALAGGGKLTEVNSLRSFGEHFGIAYQLRDDLLDLTQEENWVPRDLKIGRITLPLIHAYDNSSVQEKTRIDAALQTLTSGSKTSEHENQERILGILRRKGSFDYCERKIEEHLGQAVASISMLKETEYKHHLTEMTRVLKTKNQEPS